MTKEKKKTVDKGYYKIRQEDRADFGTLRLVLSRTYGPHSTS